MSSRWPKHWIARVGVNFLWFVDIGCARNLFCLLSRGIFVFWKRRENLTFTVISTSIAGILDSKCFPLASEVLDTYPLSMCINRESGRQQLSLAIFDSCFVSMCMTNCCAVYQHFYTMVWQQQTARHPMHNWWMRLARSAAIKIKCNGFCYYVLRNFNDGMFGLLLSNKSLCICMCKHATNKSQ